MKIFLNIIRKKIVYILQITGLKKPVYWQKRKNYLYYKKIIEIVEKYCKNCNSVIDVGSKDTEVLKEFKYIHKRVALDIYKLPNIPGVQNILSDFNEYEDDEYYDLVLCLQVLEHLEDPKPFTHKLFLTGSNIIISVPYNWHGSRTKCHVQDPVDEKKLKSWTDKDPDELHIVREINGTERMIALYLRNN